ncbi:hypothetical protein Ana3638_02280 [Anaerocolumna sedimenticola]|uniref:Uncharacterized protein n=1 Tax=Anaerocolumna sedimenticola TaxID=2696063 RepID=A0A6P1TI58_9FIRM|nr:hypothetical protein [Anaerocolumna sedimenticola]QHQ59772.1 hypothetical protein Ana3638_02280 [Anaerocolumna sedimenticola]
MNKRGKTLSIIGAISVVVTILLFFLLTSERSTMTWAGFCSILLAEIATFGGLVFLESISTKLSLIVMSAIGGGALIAIPLISIAVSLLFMVSQSHAYKVFAAIQIVSLAILVILLIIAYQVSTSVKYTSDKLLSAEKTITRITDKLKMLADDRHNKVYSEKIKRIAEDIRYSDISTTVAADTEIETKIESLKLILLSENDQKEEKANALLDDMLLLVNRRKMEVKNTKQGGI